MSKEIELTNAMLEASAVASINWPKMLSCDRNWQHSPKPGCG
jgi:hypothetical protein